MISVVCVYNDENILNKNLIKSLKNQNSEYELILIDNTQKKFNSASDAFNYAGNLAEKEFLLFVHQDMCLIGNDWLEICENLLKKDKNAVFGICGWTKYGKLLNSGIDANYANLHDNIEKVLTIDEQLIIVPKKLFKKFKFDENFNDWHCYIADYCLNLNCLNINSYILNLPILHNSPRTNRNLHNLRKEQYKLLKKYKKRYKIIFTNGVICENGFSRFICGLALKMQHINFTYFLGHKIIHFYLRIFY